MNIQLVILTVLLSTGILFRANGQSDSTKMEQKQPFKLRGYVGGVYERSSVAPVHTNSFGLQAALLIKKHWQLGFYGLRHTNGKYREQLIFPNSFQMNYKHAGLLIGYRTNLERKYEFNVESKYGFGEVKWAELSTGNSFLADRFRILQVQFSVDYLLTGFFAINGFVGYRTMQALDITGLENSDFDGIYYGVAVKLGKFR